MPLEAPFITGQQIDSHTPDPRLSGVQSDFNPDDPHALSGPLQQTFTRLDTENNEANQQQKQRGFQAQQQARQQQHDLLTKQMEFDHEQKMQQQQQQLKDRDTLYNMMSQSGGTSATMKDEQGNDMSIPFLPQDQKVADQTANDFGSQVIQNPGNFKTPEMAQKYRDMQRLNQNASARAIYTAQAQQQLNNTFDPDEKQRLQTYIDTIGKSSVNSTDRPMPYMPQPTVQPMIDTQKKYATDDNFESFDNNKEGIPNSEYQSLQNTTNPHQINEGYKRYQYFRSQPQGQDPAAFQDHQNHLNEITTARGLPPINLGASVGQDGKLAFDDGTTIKKQQLAKNYLAASELMNNGILRDDPDAEMDEAKLSKEKAETDKIRAQTEATRNGKTTKALTPQQQADEDASKGTVKRIQAVLNPDNYKKPLFAINLPGDKNKPISNALESAGYSKKDWKIIGVPDKDQVGDLSGVPETITLASGAKQKTGKTMDFEKAIVIQNKETNDTKLAFVRKNKDGSYSTQVVNGREAASAAALHNHQYKEDKETDSEINRNQASYDGSASVSPKTTSAAVPVTTPVRKTLHGTTYEKGSNGKWFKIS